jgi:hypothetical protein
MAGHLYQLKTSAPVGAFVTFKGIYDKYGQVLKHQKSGYHLIRGMGRDPLHGVRFYYSAETED